MQVKMCVENIQKNKPENKCKTKQIKIIQLISQK